MKITVIKKATNAKPNGFCVSFIDDGLLNKRVSSPQPGNINTSARALPASARCSVDIFRGRCGPVRKLRARHSSCRHHTSDRIWRSRLSRCIEWDAAACQILSVEGLARIGEDGRPIPSLAEGWTVSADGLSMSLRLRPGVTFHDGSPLTAATVVSALNMSLPQFMGPAFDDVSYHEEPHQTFRLMSASEDHPLSCSRR